MDTYASEPLFLCVFFWGGGGGYDDGFQQLVVWTASGKSYADAVIDLLDPDGKYFSYRLYREACTRHKGLNVKDLRRLGRPMDAVILIDNYVYSFGFTLDNGIPISPWTGNEVVTAPLSHSEKMVAWSFFCLFFVFVYFSGGEGVSLFASRCPSPPPPLPSPPVHCALRICF